nr:MAG TPA: nucelotide kinase [Caudoviricetes sp.]
MTTRNEMVRTLEKFCDEQKDCVGCLLEKFPTPICDFNEWTDDKLAIAYDHVCKNGEARLDGSHIKSVEINTCDNIQSGIATKATSKPDMINHPQHYTQGGIECIDALKAATVGKHGIEAVCVANVIKYLWRYEEKNGVEDVRKAKWYIERLLKELEESQQN